MKSPYTKHSANRQHRLIVRLLSLCIVTAQVQAQELTDIQASMAYASGDPVITTIGAIAQRAEQGQPLR